MGLTTEPGPWMVTGTEHRRVIAERDRARATAVRLEQELAKATAGIEARDAFATLHSVSPVVPVDALEVARRTLWICE